MKMKKKLALLLAAVILVSSLCINCSAQTQDDYGVMPCWTYIDSIVKVIAFDGTNGDFAMDVLCTDATNAIDAVMTLYYQDSDGDWIEQDQWHYNVNDCELYVGEYFTAVKGTTYKVEIEVTAYSSVYSESVSTYAQKTCPKN